MVNDMIVGSSVCTDSSYVMQPIKNHEEEVGMKCLRSPTITLSTAIDATHSFVTASVESATLSSSYELHSTFPQPRAPLDPLGFCEPCVPSSSFCHRKIRPFMPQKLARYRRNITVPREYIDYTIPPLKTSFHKRAILPDWRPVHHPEGAIYFYHEGRRVFTDADLYDSKVLAHIRFDMDAIDDFCRSQNAVRSSNVDLVLELVKEGDDTLSTLYYIADHFNRSIFFVDEFDARDIPSWLEVKGVTCPTHLEHEIQAQYWYHCQMFPRALVLTRELIDELRDILVYAMGDAMTSATSTVPYNLESLRNMLTLLSHLKENSGNNLQGSAFFLSRMMHNFARQRFYDFHGQPGARLSPFQSVHGTLERKRSWIIKCASPVLFCAPEVHLRALERVWVDEKLCDLAWAQVMRKLCSEWRGFTLYGTVLLNANVAFLAIQSVDNNSPVDYGSLGRHYRSLSQILSYFSVMFSFGCIIIGLLLDRQNTTNARRTAFEAATYMLQKSNQLYGVETLAIMYSLPYVFLMWGMITFLAAFLCMCFLNSTLWTWISVGTASFVIAAMILWCIAMAWESQVRSCGSQVKIGTSREQDGRGNDENGTRLEPERWAFPVFRVGRKTFDSDTSVV